MTRQLTRRGSSHKGDEGAVCAADLSGVVVAVRRGGQVLFVVSSRRQPGGGVVRLLQ